MAPFTVKPSTVTPGTGTVKPLSSPVASTVAAWPRTVSGLVTTTPPL